MQPQHAKSRCEPDRRSALVQLTAGAAVFTAGAAGVAAGYRPIAAFAYPILWWGLLPALDAVHFLRWGSSPMRRDWRFFLGITIPASVLFWLMYEYLNVAFPQWGYRGELEGRLVQTAFGFASFATVIPILVELYWLFGGPDPKMWRAGARFQKGFVAVGGLFLLAPVLTDWFWVNQAAWVGPAILLLPFAGLAGRATIPAALASGFLWELLNYWSTTKWHYTIHPEWPKLFEMPLAGYLGFVPFAFSTLAVSVVLQRLKPRAATVLALWIAAAAAMYGLTILYAQGGFWTPSALMLMPRAAAAS